MLLQKKSQHAPYDGVLPSCTCNNNVFLIAQRHLNVDKSQDRKKKITAINLNVGNSQNWIQMCSNIFLRNTSHSVLYNSVQKNLEESAIAMQQNNLFLCNQKNILKFASFIT